MEIMDGSVLSALGMMDLTEGRNSPGFQKVQGKETLTPGIKAQLRGCRERLSS